MELDFTSSIIVFLIAAGVIAFAGTRLTLIADKIADQTGWGEALVGAILLGGATSLSGIITSVTSAWDGHASLAMSNAIGGIAAQTLFLAIADMTYKKANLEHASASFQNLMQVTLLIILLGLVLLLIVAPEISVFGIHPGSILIVVVYIAGLNMISKAGDIPMWRPRETAQTIRDVPDPANTGKNAHPVRQWMGFGLLALVVSVAGYFIARSGIVISGASGLSETFVGSLMTAVATSLPELITTLAAIRHRALTLAVGGIVGGNTFDVLFVSFSDFAYSGSIYQAISSSEIFILALTILMSGIVLLGLLDRQQKGFAGIGWETWLLLLAFFGGYAWLFLG